MEHFVKASFTLKAREIAWVVIKMAAEEGCNGGDEIALLEMQNGYNYENTVLLKFWFHVSEVL